QPEGDDPPGHRGGAIAGGERDEHLGPTERDVVVGDERHDVQADEADGQPGEEAVQVEQPWPPRSRTERLRAEREAAQHRTERSRPRNEPRRPGDVPPQLVAHHTYSSNAANIR